MKDVRNAINMIPKARMVRIVRMFPMIFSICDSSFDISRTAIVYRPRSEAMPKSAIKS